MQAKTGDFKMDTHIEVLLRSISKCFGAFVFIRLLKQFIIYLTNSIVWASASSLAVIPIGSVSMGAQWLKSHSASTG